MRSEDEVKDLKRYLEKNYHKQIKIGQLCAKRYTSEQYVCRRFREIMGCSPKQYLMELRLTKTAKKLCTTQDSIQKTALSCGFTDPNNFSKQFRARFGVSPGRYRAENSKKTKEDV